MDEIIANIITLVIPALLIRAYCCLSYRLRLNGKHELS